MQPRRQTLPVIMLIKTAFQLLWQQRDDALRLGLVPTLMVFGDFLYGEQALAFVLTSTQGQLTEQLPPGLVLRILAFGVILLVAISLMTVNWLRFLLLGPMGATGIGLNIGRPHLSFLLAVIGFGLAAMVGAAIAGIVLSLMPAAILLLGNLVLFAALMVLLARFTPYLVGRAIGQPLSLMDSWNVSRGNGMVIAISMVLAQLPFVIGLTLLQQVLHATGFSSLAPAGTMFIVAVVQVADWMVQASVLAAAYRHLVGVRV